MTEVTATKLEQRAALALERLRAGHAPMRIPADPSDPDLVISDLLAALAAAEAERDEWLATSRGAEQGRLLMQNERDALREHVSTQQVCALNEELAVAERGCQSLRAELEAERTQTTTLLSVIRRCGETFAHALQNVRHLTGGDEKRMRAMLDEIAEEMDDPDLAAPAAEATPAATCAHDATDWACTKRRGCDWRGSKEQAGADLTCPRCGADAFAVSDGGWGDDPEEQPPPCTRPDCGGRRAT